MGEIHIKDNGIVATDVRDGFQDQERIGNLSCSYLERRLVLQCRWENVCLID